MLFYFILGILFISLGVPLLENIDSIITSWTEYIVYILAYKACILKEKIREQQEQEQQEGQEEFQIGFHQSEIKENKPEESQS